MNIEPATSLTLVQKKPSFVQHLNLVTKAQKMASAANGSPSSLPDLKKYDVFISFRGEDTRETFTSHLHAALLRNKIETYIDNRLEKGDEVWPSLVDAINDSKIFLIIFSENYASSTWCLNELVEIMECKKKGGHQKHVVIPVFYRKDPSHVRKQSGSYHRALAKHKRSFKSYNEMVHKWKDALFQAANLAGLDSSNYRTEADLIEDLIESVIKIVLQNLNHIYTSEPSGHFIHDQNYACIESLMQTKSREVQIIGIWGMGGIGKTTIAVTIFREFSMRFEASCFLENVREESSRHGLNYIFNKLLCELLQDVRISTPKIISSTIMSRLRCKKVFIVLDDVNSFELLENLLGAVHNYLGEGSKVIVTTRDKHLLTTTRAVDHIHEVKRMNIENCLKLFSLIAFNEIHPKKGYRELSERAVDYAKGLPLALKVLGLSLHSKSEIEWDSALKKLKKIPNPDIHEVLRWSFDVLDEDEKNIFLDIACFFKGRERGKVIRTLNACGFCADDGIRNLLDKALITISAKDIIQMHDLIQEMGKKIVDQECIKNPERRSRLWRSEEICDIVKNNKGTDAIECIFLDMTQTTDLHISSQAFEKMTKLRLLVFYDSTGFVDKRINNALCLPITPELPNNLRYIQWDYCPLKSLPSTCWPNKLVELSIRCSNIKKLWNGVQSLPCLETIDLTRCTKLIECPNLSDAPNLKHVILYICESLPYVHPSIFYLPRLKELDVSYCKAIKSLTSDYCSPSLQSLLADGCSNLEEFSVPMAGDRQRSWISLMSTALSEVPSSVIHLNNIRSFTFSISYAIERLPENFAEEIELSDPKKHEDDTYIILSRILTGPAFLSLKRLSFFKCESLSELPDNISELRYLEELTIWYSHLISLPKSIKYLQRLGFLIISCCEKLQYVPPLPPSIQSFACEDCISLKSVSCLTSGTPIKHHVFFEFPNCTNLDEHVYEAILKDLNFRVVHRTTTTEEEEEEDGWPNDVNNGNICYYLPSKDIVFDWFPYYSTQTWVTIEVHPDPKAISGLVFYMLLPQCQSFCFVQRFKCECYLETSFDERVYIASSFTRVCWVSGAVDQGISRQGIVSDHVFLWYDAKCCKKIMEAVKETKSDTTNNPSLKFEFYAQTEDGEECVLKECGIRWIYVDANDGGIEGCESDELQEAVPLTRQNFSRAHSNQLEADETVDFERIDRREEV